MKRVFLGARLPILPILITASILFSSPLLSLLLLSPFLIHISFFSPHPPYHLMGWACIVPSFTRQYCRNPAPFIVGTMTQKEKPFSGPHSQSDLRILFTPKAQSRVKPPRRPTLPSDPDDADFQDCSMYRSKSRTTLAKGRKRKDAPEALPSRPNSRAFPPYPSSSQSKDLSTLSASSSLSKGASGAKCLTSIHSTSPQSLSASHSSISSLASTHPLNSAKLGPMAQQSSLASRVSSAVEATEYSYPDDLSLGKALPGSSRPMPTNTARLSIDSPSTLRPSSLHAYTFSDKPIPLPSSIPPLTEQQREIVQAPAHANCLVLAGTIVSLLSSPPLSLPQ